MVYNLAITILITPNKKPNVTYHPSVTASTKALACRTCDLRCL